MRKWDPQRERNSLLSNIKAISYIIARVSIQCPTVWQILIKLHHSEGKEWSSLSSSGWNDFYSPPCSVMNCWPKKQKWTNKTKQRTRLEYPKDSQWRKEKGDWYSINSVCLFCCKSIENMPTHINRRKKKLYMSYFFSWRHLSAVSLPRKPFPRVLFMWRSNICTHFVLALVYVILLWIRQSDNIIYTAEVCEGCIPHRDATLAELQGWQVTFPKCKFMFGCIVLMNVSKTWKRSSRLCQCISQI